MNILREKINDILSEDETILLADGFESAFIGIARQFNTAFAVYDRDKCIEILTENMSYEEAETAFTKPEKWCNI